MRHTYIDNPPLHLVAIKLAYLETPEGSLYVRLSVFRGLGEENSLETDEEVITRLNATGARW